MEDELDFLGSVLDSFDEELNAKEAVKEPEIKPAKKRLTDVDVPFLDFEEPPDLPSLVLKEKTNCEKSVVHTGDTDSSEDEDNKYFEESNYDSYGRKIRQNLKKIYDKERRDRSEIPRGHLWNSSKTDNEENKMFGLAKQKPKAKEKFDAYMEPIFGIRIVNPLFSSSVIKEKMVGKTPVSFYKVKSHVKHGDLKSDWVIGGVIVTQSPPKISQKGKKYVIWTLSDLKDGLKTVGLFLFGKCYDQLWKTPAGTVIAVLNPNVLGQNDKTKDEATLSVLHPDQVMIWGRSKDLGKCKAKKKNGDDCTSFVNISQCEYCMFHVHSEYRKFMGRGELQSPTCGLARIRNKVLGKNEVFYGGKSFTAIPDSAKHRKEKVKDIGRLSQLGGAVQQVKLPSVETSVYNMQSRTSGLMKLLNNSGAEKTSLKRKDTDRLKSLFSTPNSKTEKPPGAPVSEKSFLNTEEQTSPSSSVGNKKNQMNIPSSKVNLGVPTLKKPEVDEISFEIEIPKSISKTPKLEKPSLSTNIKDKPSQNAFNKVMSGTIENNKMLNKKPMVKPTTPTSENVSIRNNAPAIASPIAPIPKSSGASKKPSAKPSRAKLKALEFVKNKGKISKENPQGVDRKEIVAKSLKRDLDIEEEEEINSEEPPAKKQMFSARFLELLQVESKNKALVEEYELEQVDAYYVKMERKEAMEEKMMNTFKMECKAVKCLKCKYTWFSASDSCKESQHPLKVVDAFKRFFKCSQCQNRTVTLNIIPTITCKKCGSSHWVKTSMMKEKLVANPHSLSIRGGEQKFVNSVVQNGSLDLLVPDE